MYNGIADFTRYRLLPSSSFLPPRALAHSRHRICPFGGGFPFYACFLLTIYPILIPFLTSIIYIGLVIKYEVPP